MTSSSSLGSSQITLQFDLNRDIDGAAQDVQAAIAKAIRQLPSTMTTPPSYRKVNPADQPVLYLSLSSEILPLSTINKYAETQLTQRLSMVSGVAQINVFGSQKYAVRALLDPNSLSARGIGIDEVADAISKGNSNLPTGNLYGNQQNLTIESNGQLTNADAYRNLTIAYRNGSPVHLSDLGQVVDSVENDKVASWYFSRSLGSGETEQAKAGEFPGRRAIVLAIQKQPGTNTVETMEQIKKILPNFQKQLPAAISMEVLFDRSQPIKESIEDVQFTLMLTIALVVLVIFLFLRNLSATIIPSLAVPLYCVRNSVRRFHPSVDNFIEPAFGWIWCIVNVAIVQSGSQYLCVRGHYLAHRDCKKERHYDGGLCDRGSQRWEKPLSSHLSSVPGSISPDHDDNNGSIDGDVTDRTRLWCGCRCSSPAWACCCRWIGVFAVAHVVSDSCVLHLYGSVANEAAIAQETFTCFSN